jgi:Tfp pilus assembly protein PilF
MEPPPAAATGVETAAYSKELPPEQSAKLCLATATQMDRSGQEVPAIQLYEKARAENPKYQYIAHRLAVLYDRQGHFPKALEEYQKALKMAPRDPDLLNDMGYTHYNHGRFKEAEDFLRLALQQNPKHERAWVNLGLTLGMQERYGDSFDAFKRAVPPAQAHCNLAFVLTAQKKREEAKQEYRKALRLDPNLGLARAALEKLEKAPTEGATAEAKKPAAPAQTARKPVRPKGAVGGGWVMDPDAPKKQPAAADKKPATGTPPRPLPILPSKAS